MCFCLSTLNERHGVLADSAWAVSASKTGVYFARGGAVAATQPYRRKAQGCGGKDFMESTHNRLIVIFIAWFISLHQYVTSGKARMKSAVPRVVVQD